MAVAMIFKNQKSQYLHSGWTDFFYKIWHGDASRLSSLRQVIKFARIQKLKMVAAAILKNRKIAISLQWID